MFFEDFDKYEWTEMLSLSLLLIFVFSFCNYLTLSFSRIIDVFGYFDPYYFDDAVEVGFFLTFSTGFMGYGYFFGFSWVILFNM